jgi:hypothetical protein
MGNNRTIEFAQLFRMALLAYLGELEVDRKAIGFGSLKIAFNHQILV